METKFGFLYYVLEQVGKIIDNIFNYNQWYIIQRKYRISNK